MTTEEGKVREIRRAFFKYAKENELSAFDTSGYFARQILPGKSFFLKVKVIDNLIESGGMVMVNRKWVIKNL
jgi:hypothetical protein